MRPTTLLTLIASALLGALGASDARRQSVPVALCPNWDTVYVHPTPWEREHGHKLRAIPNPCTEAKP